MKKLTNTWKHFAYMHAVGLAVWAFAYVGKAHGLGYFPNIAAIIVTVYVEYRQWSLSWKPFWTLVRERGFDTLIDIAAGNLGFWLGYNLLLKLTAGGWIV